jgi:EAL domain-containing protein (putative c-di-GMP-specific phosphodiesterase class I)
LDLPRDLVLVVDDEPAILRALERSLGDAFDVVTCTAGKDAMAHLERGEVSVVLIDLRMPGMSGLELLAATHALDPDLPFVLITGMPSLASATKAIERGVFRYLPKPLDDQEVSAVVAQASQFRRLALVKRAALELRGAQSTPRPPGVARSFLQALEQLWVAFQPIVSLSDKRVYGYEALMRTSHPDFRSPSQLLDAAERNEALDVLGRAVRARAVEGLSCTPEGALLFVNLHPRDLTDPMLASPESAFGRAASRVVLEITERASLEGIADLQRRVSELRRLGFRIAIDDLGAGYAGLTSFALLEPEIIKVDMSLTRNIDRSAVKQKLVGSLASLCREMGTIMVVEGVETPSERDALITLGCDLLQGHLFGYPQAVPGAPAW